MEGWRTYAEGVSGTGLTTGGPCGRGADFGSRLPKALAHHPQILVVEGGLNDTHSPRGSLTAALTRVLDRSSKVPRLIVIGPPAAPRYELPEVRRIDGELHAACSAPQCTYVSTLGWKLPFMADQVHLTPAGHAMFAEHVSAALHGRG